MLGAKVKIGYYDQAQQLLTETNTIFDEISNAYPDLTNTKIRNVLAAFLFTGEDAFKPVSALSGGERGRLSLAKLMLSNANFLILDEPTNHLDVYSKEILEDALRNYTGTVFYVSHDRYFVNRTATRILELEQKSITEYKGDYDYYLEKKSERLYTSGNNSVSAAANTSASNNSESDTKLSWKMQKEANAAQRKRANDLKKTEARIEELELEAKKIDEEMATEEIATNSNELIKLSKKRGEIEDELNKLYEEWEKLAD